MDAKPQTKKLEQTEVLLNLIIYAINEDDVDFFKGFLEYENGKEILENSEVLHRSCLAASANVLEFFLTNNITADLHTKIDIAKYTRDNKHRNCTPLDIACTRKKGVRLMKLLVLAGADCNQKVEYYWNDVEVYPIHYVSMSLLKLDLLKIMVENGCDVHKVALFGYKVPGREKIHTYEESALSLAVRDAKGTPEHVECIKYLLQVGCDPNFPKNPLYFPLHRAVRKSWFGSVKALLQYGADYNYPVNKDNGTRDRPLIHQAIYNNKIGILQLLFDYGASPNQEPKLTENILHFESRTPLAYACQTGKAHMVEYLLMSGAHPNDPCGTICWQDKDTNYDHLITSANVVWFLAASFYISPNCVNVLANYGADFNFVEPVTGFRPLEVATYRTCDIDHTRPFIESGSDVNLPFSNGNTPLHNKLEKRELRWEYSQETCVNWIDLLAPRVDNLELKDTRGRSALYKTVKNCAWECTYALLKHGASLWAEQWFLQQLNILDKKAVKEWKEDSQRDNEIFGNLFEICDSPEKVKNEPYQLKQLEMLYDYFYREQMTLKFICRATVRKYLNQQGAANVDQLAIPRSLIDYIKNIQS